MDDFVTVRGRLPLDAAEIALFERFLNRLDDGAYSECSQIVDLMEKLGIV